MGEGRVGSRGRTRHRCCSNDREALRERVTNTCVLIIVSYTEREKHLCCSNHQIQRERGKLSGSQNKCTYSQTYDGRQEYFKTHYVAEFFILGTIWQFWKIYWQFDFLIMINPLGSLLPRKLKRIHRLGDWDLSTYAEK